MKRKNTTIFLLFVLSPLLSLPFIIKEINKESSGATYLMALFMAIFAYAFPVMGDLYRHNLIYFDFNDYTFPQFLMYLHLKSKPDFIVWSLSWFFCRSGIPFEYIRCIATLIEYCIFAFIYERYVRPSNLNHKDKIKIYALMCISFFPLYQILGMRHGLAMSLFVLGVVFLYFDGKRNMALICFFISAYTHFHFMPLSVLAVTCRYFTFINNKKLFWCFFILSIAFGIILTPLLLKMSMGDTDYIDGYTSDGYYGKSFSFEGKSGASMFITRFWYIPLLLFFIKEEIKDLRLTKSQQMERYRGLVYATILITSVTWSYLTFSERTGKVTGCLLCLYLCIKSTCTKGWLRAIPVLILILTFSQLYGLRLLMFYTDNNLYNLWKPLPAILEYNYDMRWFNTYIIDKGELNISGDYWKL